MSLPKAFTSAEDYFVESLTFFHEYQHLYNFPNTDILLNHILELLNIADIENIDVFDENFAFENLNDDYLDRFFEKLQRLRVYYSDIHEDESLNCLFDVPLSPKKRHEIIYLAKEIREQFDETKCDVVVDFGSGLGYLDQKIYEVSNYKVLGLECNESHYVGAKKRQRKYHENSLDHVKYIRHTVGFESNKNIENFLQDKFPNHSNVGITGLHACADLTNAAISIFLKMATAKSLLILPCCYHKMSVNDGKFINFPLSCSLKNIFDTYKGEEFMKVPFLRLAAQPPNLTEKLEDSVFNLLARAVLQVYAVTCNCKLKRNKRKAVKTKTTNNDFENYILDAQSGYTMIPNDTSELGNKYQEFDLEKLRLIWRLTVTPLTLKKAGIFIKLQNYLQPVIENFVLFDRLIFLRENGVKYCAFKKIFNEKLSPRCLALVAHK